MSLKLQRDDKHIQLSFNYVDNCILLEPSSSIKELCSSDTNIDDIGITDNDFVSTVLHFSSLLKVVDNFLLHNGVKTTQNSKKKALITGNYQDSSNNSIEATGVLTNCSFRFQGENNKIIISPNANLKNLYFEFLGNNGTIEIGKAPRLSGTIRVGYSSSVKIEDNVSSTNAVYITCAENTEVFIGEDCMFATGNQIRTDDAHAIYDVHTGKRVNLSKSIHIGKHVWIGYNAVILGGAYIGDGSIIGMSSLVKKKFPNNCVIAGNPAKIIKKDVFWERPNVLHQEHEITFSEEEINSKFYCSPTEEL